jgi:FdhD protein
MTRKPPPVARISANAWRNDLRTETERAVPEEVAVALTYDRETFAVMMASPVNLEDFGIGFSLSEGIVSSAADILDFETVVVDEGIECRMTLAPRFREKLQARRRRIAGPVGCGLCGLDSLKEASRPLPKVEGTARLSARAIADAFKRMSCLQVLNNETRAVHAAAFFNPTLDQLMVREDIGRHNALDKLIGAIARRGDAPGVGAVLLTSRVSLDLIQKTATFGAGILAAISVPTARAVREAQDAGITLIAVARDDGFEIFSHPDRIIF